MYSRLWNTIQKEFLIGNLKNSKIMETRIDIGMVCISKDIMCFEKIDHGCLQVEGFQVEFYQLFNGKGFSC